MKKYVLIIIASIFILSLIIGFCNPIDLSLVGDLNFNYLAFFLNITLYILALLLTFLGLPFYFLLLIGDVFLSGIITSLFVSNFLFKGLLLSIFVILFKAITWFLLLLNSFYYLKFIKYHFSLLFIRSRIYKENKIIYLKKMLVICIILIIVSLIFAPVNNYFLIPFAKKIMLQN